MVGVVVPLAVMALGYVLGLCLLARREAPRRFTHLLALALAPGLGFGLLSVLLFFLLHFGIDPRWLWGAFAVVALLAVAALWRSRQRDRAASSPANQETPTRPLGWLLGSMLAVTVGVLAVNAWTFSRIEPYGGWDAIAIWNAHAAFLYRTETGHRDVFSSIEGGHPEYPLLLPGAVAGQYVLRGGEDTAVPQVTGASFVVGLALLVWLAVTSLGSRRLALPAVLIVLSTPVISHFAFRQCADVPVAYFSLAAVLALALQIPVQGSDERPLLPPFLVGLLLGMLAWTKNEGAVLAGIFIAMLLLVQIVTRRRLIGLRAALQAGAGAMPGLLAFAVFKTGWTVSTESQAFLADLPGKLGDAERWANVLGVVLSRLNPLTEPGRWGAVWPLLLVGAGLVLAKGRHDSRRCYVASVFCASVAAYLFSYLISPYNLRWHLLSSIDRVLMQVFSLLVVAVFSSIEPDEGPG